MELAKRYFIPLLLLAIALLTAIGDPDDRILKSIPIIPGPYRLEYAMGFTLLAGVLAFIIYRHGQRTGSQ